MNGGVKQGKSGKKWWMTFIGLMILVVGVLTACGSSPEESFQKYMEQKDYVNAVTVYNEEIIGTEAEEEILQTISTHIEGTLASYYAGEIECDAARSAVLDFEKVKNEAIGAKIAEFISVSDTVETAVKLYDGGSIEEAFYLLAVGVQEYPENEKLAETLVNFHEHYIISTKMQVADLCDAEEYEQALEVVEQALAEYECEEFENLRESVKEQKSKLYKLKNDIIKKIQLFDPKWEVEECDVKQAAGKAGAYIMKSGKKLILGDYTDEEVTVLSVSGDLASSIVGLDLASDVRDLAFDVTHWGEKEYFMADLATDMVAVIPVVGMVKYLDHFKEAGKLVDSVGDIGKHTDDMIDAAKTAGKADNIKDTMKAAEGVKDAAKTEEVAKGILKRFEYTPIDTINKKWVGSKYEGVPFKSRKVKYSDGRQIQGVFPKFKSFADVKLKEDLYQASSYVQNKYCNEQLKKNVTSVFGKFKKVDAKFTPEQLEDIKNGKTPSGFTWHHNEEEGLMQLVNTEKHVEVKHTGGQALWGAGYAS